MLQRRRRVVVARRRHHGRVSHGLHLDGEHAADRRRGLGAVHLRGAQGHVDAHEVAAGVGGVADVHEARQGRVGVVQGRVEANEPAEGLHSTSGCAVGRDGQAWLAAHTVGGLVLVVGNVGIRCKPQVAVVSGELEVHRSCTHVRVRHGDACDGQLHVLLGHQHDVTTRALHGGHTRGGFTARCRQGDERAWHLP